MSCGPTTAARWPSKRSSFSAPLYDIEHEARNLAHDERLRIRQNKSSALSVKVA
jgi:hypothetical protein